jgi:ATP-binding protein involved in chromosome partitioning
MAWLVQPDGSKLELFGRGGGQAVAERLTKISIAPVSLLGQIPMSIALREGSDAGQPIVLSNPADPAAQVIAEIAKMLAGTKLGLAGKHLGISPV